MKLLQYKGAFVVLSAGALGVSLICAVSVIALWRPRQTRSITAEPLNLADVASNNLAAAALRKQVDDILSAPVSTAPPTSTATITTPTNAPSNTPKVGMVPVLITSTP